MDSWVDWSTNSIGGDVIAGATREARLRRSFILPKPGDLTTASQRILHKSDNSENSGRPPPRGEPAPRQLNSANQRDEYKSASMATAPSRTPGNDSTTGSSSPAREPECSKQEIAIGCRQSDRRFVPYPTGSCTGS